MQHLNGRCKRHGGASTGPIKQEFGKDHHRYVHGLRTKEVIIMRKLVAEMNNSFKVIKTKSGKTADFN